MGLNGKGTFVPYTRRPLFQGVKFHLIGIKGNVIESVLNAADIQYVDADRRDETTLVFLKSGGSIRVTDDVSAAANQWGQRENVVKYRRAAEDVDRVLEVAMRVDDITSINVSTRDGYTVLVKAPFAVFPVVGKMEKIVERTSYCRPFATFTMISDKMNVPAAIPLDSIIGVEVSHADNTTLVRTSIGRMPIRESVDDAMRIIDREAKEFEDALAALEASRGN